MRINGINLKNTRGRKLGQAWGLFALMAAGLVVSVAPARASSGSRDLRPAVLRAAETLRGHAYVWDAAGPTEFDCSGFVYWVVNETVGHARFPIGRVNAVDYRDYLASASVHAAVDCARARPGDIIYFPRSPHARDEHIGFVQDPVARSFIAAQSVRKGVAPMTYGPRDDGRPHRAYECYTNVWAR